MARTIKAAGHKFCGTREQKVKQIGNAVHVDQAKALISEVVAA